MNLSSLLDHLETKTGTMINIDPIHPALYAADALKLRPEQQIHRSAFCEFAKRYSRPLPVSCFQRKIETRNLAAKGKGFCATCPFGIQEWIQPVMVEGRHAATIYVGPFSGGDLKREIGGETFRGESPPPLPESLTPLREAAGFIADVIRTEIEICLAEGHTLDKQKPGSFYREITHRFIEGNYREDVQLRDLARTLRMSPNYLSSRIRQECGRTFRQLLTVKRLAVACSCLEFEPDRSISEIAFLVGYNDSNYFSTVFHKQLGVSPSGYRQGEKSMLR